MARIMKNTCYTFILVLLTYYSHSAAVSIGSDSVLSRQPNVTFFSADNDNIVNGFASLEKGFSFNSNLTTCTFNSFMPVSGDVLMLGGSLYLQKDFVVSNSCRFFGGGTIYGGGYSVEMGNTLLDVDIPTNFPTDYLSLVLTNSIRASLTAGVNSLDWSLAGDYLAAGCLTAATRELKIYNFDYAKLNPIYSAVFSTNVNSVSWNTKANYLAVGRVGASAQNNLGIYFLNTANNTVTNPSNVMPVSTSAVTAVKWHPSGAFLAVGTNSTLNELMVYPFNLVTGALGTRTIRSLANSRIVSNDALSWSPGGNLIVVGMNNRTTVGAAEVIVCSFDGSSLTITTSAEVGATVNTVDWSPTGTYVAVGITGLTTNLRIYNHDIGTNTLREVRSARQIESNAVRSVRWDPSGNYLLVGTTQGVSSQVRIYYFDKNQLTLTRLNTIPSTLNINIVQWSGDGNYFAWGDASSNIFVYQNIEINSLFASSQFVFDNTNLVLNGRINVNGSMQFSGDCVVSGRGNRMTLMPGASIAVRPGSNLVLEDLQVNGIGSSNLACMADNAAITLRDSMMVLSSSYTFSTGSMYFDGSVLITGTNAFNYSTGLASTIGSQSVLYFAPGTAFNYLPRRPVKDLLFFQDSSSSLYLDAATLSATRTGLTLSAGRLVIDDLVTFSSSAIYIPEAIQLQPSLTTLILSGATMQLNGLVSYGS